MTYMTNDVQSTINDHYVRRTYPIHTTNNRSKSLLLTLYHVSLPK